jgi:PST family polysaccharide transporter
VNAFGLNGAGIAFFGSYIFHVLMLYLIARQLSGFRWSTTNVRIGLLFISILILIFLSFYGLSYRLAMAVGILALVASLVYSMRSLVSLVSLNVLPRPILRVLEWFRLVEAAT